MIDFIFIILTEFIQEKDKVLKSVFNTSFNFEINPYSNMFLIEFYCFRSIQFFLLNLFSYFLCNPNTVLFDSN